MRDLKSLFYVAILLSLLLYVGFALYRMIPFDLHHVVYVCQSLLQNLPEILVYSASALGILIALKLFIDFVFITNYTKSFQLLPQSQKLLYIAKKYELRDQVVLYKANSPAAFCIGMVRPKIYISSAMIALLNDAELEAVVLHEMYHLKHRNNLMLFTFNLFSYILFLFPFVRDLKKQYEMQEEIKADKMACDQLRAKKPLLQALKKMLMYREPALSYYVAGFSKTIGIEHRIRSIIGEHEQFNLFPIRNIAISLISLSIVSVFILLPVNKSHVHAQGVDVMVMCYDNNNCQKMCKQNKTVVLTPTESPAFFTPAYK